MTVIKTDTSDKPLKSSASKTVTKVVSKTDVSDSESGSEYDSEYDSDYGEPDGKYTGDDLNIVDQTLRAALFLLQTVQTLPFQEGTEVMNLSTAFADAVVKAVDAAKSEPKEEVKLPDGVMPCDRVTDTSKWGTIHGRTANELIQHFGPPRRGDDKISLVWHFKIDDDHYVCVYDYEQNAAANKNAKVIWSVGAADKDKESVKAFAARFPDLDIRIRG